MLCFSTVFFFKSLFLPLCLSKPDILTCSKVFGREFIHILIIDLYFWFAVAIGVRRDLKLDSHKVSVTPHSFSSCPHRPSLQIELIYLVAILCLCLDSKLHNLSFAHVTRPSFHRFAALIWCCCIVTGNAAMERVCGSWKPHIVLTAGPSARLTLFLSADALSMTFFRRNWRTRCCLWKRSCSCTRRRKWSVRKWQNMSRYCQFHQYSVLPESERCGGSDYLSIVSLFRTRLNTPKHRSRRNLKPFIVSWRSRRRPDCLL